MIDSVKNGLEIKVLDEQDIPLMKDLKIEGFRQFSLEYLKRFIKTQDTYGFIAKENNIVVGLCYGHVFRRPDKDSCGFHLSSIGVAEQFQNRGIGSKLLDFVQNFAFEKLQCCKCFLSTLKSDAAACHFYEKQGWTSDSDDVLYYINRKTST